MIDTLTTSKRYIEGGFTPQQAETLATEQARFVNDETAATKADLRQLGVELKGEITATKADVRNLEIALRAELAIIKWMMGFVLAGMLAIGVKFFVS